MMMDVLEIVSKLCLLFQRKDLDLTLVGIGVKNTLDDLRSFKENPTSLRGVKTHTATLQETSPTCTQQSTLYGQPYFNWKFKH